MKLRAILFVLAALTILIFVKRWRETNQGKLIPLTNLVVIPRDASVVHKTAATELATFLRWDKVTEMDVNPVCCLWIEKPGWKPDLETSGYIIVNQKGGSVILSSDDDQLHAAIQSFKQVVQWKDNRAHVPLGVLTSYPIAQR